jgi:EAL domain-containing protein (putative c-di-GMP-specific phosphodiesterase class I)
VLYLAEVCRKSSFLRSKVELKVLAALQADNSWVAIQLNAYISSSAVDKFKLGDWVLVDLDQNQNVISIQPATRQIIGLLKNSADAQGKTLDASSQNNGMETPFSSQKQDSPDSTFDTIPHSFSQALSLQESTQQDFSPESYFPALRFLHPSDENGLPPSNAQVISHHNLEPQQSLRDRLLKAIENNELSLYYQPSVHLRSKNITAVEAFLRWNSLALPLNSPAQIIALAEEDDLIYGITHWVLESACLQVKTWHEKGFYPLKISINLSAKQILENNFSEKIKSNLSNINFNQTELELEICENALLKNPDQISRVICDLKEFGVRATLDHFSGNFEMFQFFQSHLFDVIKIDRDLLQKATEKIEELDKLKAIIMLAKSCNLQIIAEGVEKREQLDLLSSIDCEAVQGYLIDHPLSVVDTTDVLQANWLGRPLM